MKYYTDFFTDESIQKFDTIIRDIEFALKDQLTDILIDFDPDIDIEEISFMTRGTSYLDADDHTVISSIYISATADYYLNTSLINRLKSRARQIIIDRQNDLPFSLSHMSDEISFRDAAFNLTLHTFFDNEV